jgi:uncharacterized protein DUF3300
MNSQDATKILSVVLSFILVTTSPQLLCGYQASAWGPANDSGNPTETVPLSTSQLEALVAPIALYPDSLVAQILGAASFRQWPSTSLWVIGTLVAISMVMTGITRLMMALAVRKLVSHPSASPAEKLAA